MTASTNSRKAAPKSPISDYTPANLMLRTAPAIPKVPAALLTQPPATDGRRSISKNAMTILEKRYLTKDASGKPTETVATMFWRVALTLAWVDVYYGATESQALNTATTWFYRMWAGDFEPNSPTLMNAGRPLGQLSACFVLPVEDALSNGKDGIYDTLSAMALIHQSGGGTGFSFSRLRQRGAIVRSTTGVASGPISFMTLYNASTEAVKQGGTRRGANMGILRVDHPDVMAFIHCKDDTTQITNFNISVGITDAFMAAVAADADYNLIDPKTGEVTGTLHAPTVWTQIIEGGHRTGEPGVFFIDRANHFNPVPHLGAYEATNPCGEQPLLPYDVCNLGSVNIGNFVVDGAIDWKAFMDVTRELTHMLDNVIDANRFPLAKITDLSQRIRRIGAGPMGVADALIRCGVAYDSNEGVALSAKLAATFDEATKLESERLATERGTFPEWERSIWGPDATCARDAQGNRIRPMRKLRNCNTDTVAPTGTISIIAGCSSGIEPLFAVAFMRNQAGALMPDVNADFVAMAKAQGWHSDDVMTAIAASGTLDHPAIPADVRALFPTANFIAPEFHVRHQAAWQDSNDSAISKTTNFANSATVEDVRAIYELAYQLKCKGVTVYRDGSRSMQVLSTGTTAAAITAQAGGTTGSGEAALNQNTVIADLQEQLTRTQERLRSCETAQSKLVHAPKSRPDALEGTSIKQDTPSAALYVTVNRDADTGAPFEVFVQHGKGGGDAAANAEAMGRLISLSLRLGGTTGDIIRNLRGISSEKATGFGANKVLSVPDAVAQALQKYEKLRAGVQVSLFGEPATPAPSFPAAKGPAISDPCPDCGTQLTLQEGCNKCPNSSCGFSKCG